MAFYICLITQQGMPAQDVFFRSKSAGQQRHYTQCNRQFTRMRFHGEMCRLLIFKENIRK